MSDYTIVVKNIPKDTTMQQILEHFNELYPLDRVDFAGRPPIAGAIPVKITDNTQNPLYLNTWISECVILKKIGKLITIFREKEKLMIQLYRYIYMYVYIHIYIYIYIHT
jgi:RNA recognition motif-containing protein